VARPDSRDLYNSLYLFFARELRGRETSTIDFTERFPDGLWTTCVDTGCGAVLHRPPLHVQPYYNWIAPTNTVMFANTGGDGIFYSFLEAGRPWSDRSPVVVTYPAGMLRDEPSWIVGGCLRDFLRLGRWVGFFSLGNLVVAASEGARDAIRTLAAQKHPDWISRSEARRLGRMAAAFELEPLPNVSKRIAGWQRRFGPLVRHPRACGPDA
jgi:hypothetical protein